MDRRATLATIFGRRGQAPALPKMNTGLAPYAGPWEYEQAAHLLRRAMFGPNYEQIKEAVSQGLEATLEALFADHPLPGPPVNHDNEEDPNVPIGETWVNSPYSNTVNLRFYRRQSLRAWTIEVLLREGVSIREKLTLFWHNHFAVANVNDAMFLYRHITLLRTYACGNFRELVKEVTVDPSMLRFLNGNQNTKNAPNENFARELLELFTIGKGPLAGSGDYTNYTEADIIAMSRILTGWKDRGYFSANPNVTPGAFFRPNQHDTGSKQLSHRFGEAIIDNMDELEYAHLIDIIFEQPEVARFICRKLYRWFIYYTIDEETEQNVIGPMAQLIIDNDYEIKPALMALLRSDHFFNMLNVGPMIKNPIDFLISAIKPFETAFPEELADRYTAYQRLFTQTSLQQMEYFNPPSVAGWKAYYQEPQFYRTWINATTLPLRMEMAGRLVNRGYYINGFRLRADPLAFIGTLDNPTDPNSLIEEIRKILFPQPITDGQKAALKEILIPGLPDFEWTVEYSTYLANPNDEDIAASVANKLRQLLEAMLNMSEFYLS